MARKPANPDQIVPSTIAIRTDGMKPEIVQRIEDYIRNDGIRSAVTIAVRALVEYVGIDVDNEFDGAIYVKPVRTRSTIKLTPEQKAERLKLAAEQKRNETHKALRLMEFVQALASRGEALDAKNMQAFEVWYSKQPPPVTRTRKPKDKATASA